MTNVIDAVGAGTSQALRLDLDFQELRKRFREDGFVVISNVVATEVLTAFAAKVHAKYAEMRQTGDLFSGGGSFSGHLNCYPGEDARSIYGTLEARGLIDFVRTISPVAIRQPNIGCNYNLPKSGKQHYHTDRPFRKEFMILNIAVVNTNLVNGAIDVLPGTHRRFYPFWRFVTGRLFRRTTRLPLYQGDVLIRSSNLWHRGMPNKSSTPRPMLAFTWEDGGNDLADPFAVDGGKITFHPNWFRPTFLGRLRERIFVTAPLTYSAYRFIDSVLTSKGY
jgi:hypothetical protein